MIAPRSEREERLEKAARLAERALRGELSPAVAEAALAGALAHDDDALDARHSCLGRTDG